MLDYKLLEALGCVIHEQGFDKAAQRLFISQSAVSQRIKALEEQTGQILITRTVPPQATPEGRLLLKHYLQVKILESDLINRAGQEESGGLTSISVGVNADSLSTWFFPALDSFLKTHSVVLDLRVDDQAQTHKMLRNGDVSACISSEKKTVQGCRAVHIGTMTYRMTATPDFAAAYDLIPLDKARLAAAPAVVFNRKDDLHQLFFKKYFKMQMPKQPVYYVPSSEGFARVIIEGLACGMLPDLQGREHIRKGDLTDLAPGRCIRVDLYWHCWNIGSALLDALSGAIVKNAAIC